MANIKTYTQVKLVNADNMEEVVWIPTEHAILNKSLRVKKANGEWDTGWIVTEVYEPRPAHVVEKKNLAHRYFRDVLAG